VLVCIGVLAGLPQPAAGQERASGAKAPVGALSLRDDRIRDRFERLLSTPSTRDLAQGWQLAADYGRPAAPLLWEMLRRAQSNVGPRLVYLAAAVIAGGPGEDERLFAWLDPQTTMLEERVMVGFLLAMGPDRARTPADFWPRLLGPNKATQPILGVAARLAAARFPGTEAGAPALGEEDPGLLAAAAFAGLPVPPGRAARTWNLQRPEPHAEFFWRGCLLAGLRAPGQGLLLDRAREVQNLASDPYAAVRGAAALFRAKARDVRAEGTRPDWRLLQLLVVDTTSAAAVQPWLQPEPQPFDDEPQRLAVAYVLSRPPGTVVADRARWGSDQRIRRHVAVALAWRLLGEENPTPVADALPDVPEWYLVQWASGRAVAREGSCEDPALEAAIALAAAGRLPRPVARGACEEALWRWGSHPGLGAFDAERLFVRDLMLLGSRQGGKYLPHVRPHQHYQPAGIDKDHEFFDIAIPLWDFLSRPRLPLPSEHRLR